jgi:imidazoleglycerol-phosphate dehydratase
LWLAQSKSALRTACDTLVRAMERTSEHVPATLPARIELGGSGTASVATGLPVLDHLLGLVAKHSGFDLHLEVAPGGPDAVATAAGRALGEALRGLLEGEGVAGYGMAIMPADEALANVVLEASGRPLLVSNVDLSDAHVAGLERDLVSGFLRELAEAAGLTMHVRLLHGEDAGHVLDAIFKALGGALANAAAPSRKE